MDGLSRENLSSSKRTSLQFDRSIDSHTRNGTGCEDKMQASAAVEQTGEAPVLVDRPAPRVALLTLNRPQVHNALDRPAMAALRDALEGAGADDSVGAIVLTGAGPTFCSGDDLKALRSESPERFAGTIEDLQTLTACLFALPKPVVAALNGPAYGAGLELVLACDARLATEPFLAATPEVRLGLVPTNGASLLLPLLVGQSRARNMMLGGGTKSAAWCLEAGLVDEILPSEALLPRAVALAEEMAKGAPGAIAAIRHMLNAPLADAFAEALQLEAESCVAARRTSECAEGVDAFFARRPPDWSRG
jgi:enoyl-CoA hydratase/carnithine racemase